MRRSKLNREERANIGKEEAASAFQGTLQSLMIHFLTCHGIFQLIDDMESAIALQTRGRRLSSYELVNGRQENNDAGTLFQVHCCQ